jgi:hypothetical protein
MDGSGLSDNPTLPPFAGAGVGGMVIRNGDVPLSDFLGSGVPFEVLRNLVCQPIFGTSERLSSYSDLASHTVCVSTVFNDMSVPMFHGFSSPFGE